jgi:hypothetical protein
MGRRMGGGDVWQIGHGLGHERRGDGIGQIRSNAVTQQPIRKRAGFKAMQTAIPRLTQTTRPPRLKMRKPNLPPLRKTHKHLAFERYKDVRDWIQ